MNKAYSPTIKMQFGNTEITVSFSEENENDVRSNIISLLLGIYKARMESEILRRESQIWQKNNYVLYSGRNPKGFCVPWKPNRVVQVISYSTY